MLKKQSCVTRPQCVKTLRVQRQWNSRITLISSSKISSGLIFSLGSSLDLTVATQAVLTANPSLAVVELEAKLLQLINDMVSEQDPTCSTIRSK